MDQATHLRFLKYTNKVDGGCWLWTGALNSTGRGRLNIGGHNIYAYRLAYEHYVGPVSDGLCVCHSCDNPACVNPAHLWVGTHYENMQDMTRKGRASVTKGEKCGKAKLKEWQVREIISARGTAAEIGKRYGVAKWTVYNIKHGLRWAHVPRDCGSSPSP